MAIEVTMNLDSGCFLPVKNESMGCVYEVGYFQNPQDVPDIRVYVDGEEKEYKPPFKMGNDHSTITVRQKNRTGTCEGAKSAAAFHPQLLHMKQLYKEDVEMKRDNFDYVLRFEGGLFLPSMVKPRGFKQARKDNEGSFTVTDAPKEYCCVSHNIAVHFTLQDGDVLELVRGTKVLLSTNDLGAYRRIEIELPVDNTIGNKFYHDGFKDARPDGVYWLPNECDPPPNCSQPPCDGTPLP